MDYTGTTYGQKTVAATFFTTLITRTNMNNYNYNHWTIKQVVWLAVVCYVALC